MNRNIKRSLKHIYYSIWSIGAKLILNKIRLRKYRHNSFRCLEIGPGGQGLKGFETLDIAPGKHVNYVLDCSKKLPFSDGSFDIIYSSHVLEHIPWYFVERTLKEWVRILKPCGQLEIWVPDGIKICKAFVDAELMGDNYIDLDGWYKYNPEKDSCIWASGRIFTYGDGYGTPQSPNWHKAIFSMRYLKLIMRRAGLKKVEEMKKEELRGDDHGWINLGVKGSKP